jgi:hypothetical protein
MTDAVSKTFAAVAAFGSPINNRPTAIPPHKVPREVIGNGDCTGLEKTHIEVHQVQSYVYETR